MKFSRRLLLRFGCVLALAGCAGEGRLASQPPWSDYMHRTLRVVQPSYLSKGGAWDPPYIDVWANPSLRNQWGLDRERYLRDIPIGSKVVLESIQTWDDVLGGSFDYCTGHLWVPGETKPIHFSHIWSRFLLAPWETEPQAIRRITMTSGQPSKPLPTTPLSRVELEQAYEQMQARHRAYREFMQEYARRFGKSWSQLSSAERKDAYRIFAGR